MFSVVRGGSAILDGCDVVNNGAEAVTVEDLSSGSTVTLTDNFMTNNGDGENDITPAR